MTSTTLQAYATYVRGIDLVAVDRVLDGSLHHSKLSPEERLYAARNSTGSAKSVGRRLGVTEKTIIRWREDGDGDRESDGEGSS
jgi:hypothetical protein